MTNLIQGKVKHIAFRHVGMGGHGSHITHICGVLVGKLMYKVLKHSNGTRSVTICYESNATSSHLGNVRDADRMQEGLPEGHG